MSAGNKVAGNTAGSYHCFTLNNYTDYDIAQLKKLKKPITYCAFAQEISTTGTPHLQGVLISSNRILSRIKKATSERIHLEPMQDDSEHAIGYCRGECACDHCQGGNWKSKSDPNKTKERNDTFWEGGTYVARSACTQGQRNDLNVLADKIKAGVPYETLRDEFPSTVARYDRFISNWTRDVRQKTEAAAAASLLAGEIELTGWQEEALSRLNSQSNREVLWVWSEQGARGKTTLCNWLIDNNAALIITGGKLEDMKHIYAKELYRYVVFNFARSSHEGTIATAMIFIEHLKDGSFSSSKYDGGPVRFRPPKVLVLANQPPDPSKWSADRAYVMKVD